MKREPILGHSTLLDRLQAGLERDALHHALLFEGPPGVGKATVALHLAMAANCDEEALSARPCGRCRSCTTIRSGSHPDVVLLTPDADSASGQISVKTVREIVRQAAYHRYGARKRFVIVDPATALAPAAANALLKTLEEPPEGTHFVLITTNAKALLPTIVSRCQRMRFGPVPPAELTAWLGARGVEEAELVASASLGCPGVAVTLSDGALAKRRATRDALAQVLAGELNDLFDYSKKLCSGGRSAYRPKVEMHFEILAELLRDAALAHTRRADQALHRDRPELVNAWSQRLWPDGLVACERALAEARIDLERMVSGRTAVDALLCTVREELGVPDRPLAY